MTQPAADLFVIGDYFDIPWMRTIVLEELYDTRRAWGIPDEVPSRGLIPDEDPTGSPGDAQCPVGTPRTVGPRGLHAARLPGACRGTIYGAGRFTYATPTTTI